MKKTSCKLHFALILDLLLTSYRQLVSNLFTSRTIRLGFQLSFDKTFHLEWRRDGKSCHTAS